MNRPKQHIPDQRLVEFMLGQTRLSDNEQEHLPYCERCFAHMVNATKQYLIESTAPHCANPDETPKAA